MKNFRPVDRDTGFLMPPSMDEWLPEKHLARFVVEVIAGLDLRAMLGSYRSRGARIGSRFLNNLGFVKAVFGAQIGIGRIVMSAICPPIANSYHLSLITLRVS